METTKLTLTGLDSLRWLSAAGARFCKVAAWNESGEWCTDPGKQAFPKGWQDNPLTTEAAVKHLRAGGNIGLLAGDLSEDKQGGHLCILDADENYSLFIDMFPWAKDAPTVVRDGADKGKIIVCITGDLPKIKRFKHNPTDKHPFFEYLATGSQGVIAGKHPAAGADYTLINTEKGIPSFTPEKLNAICEIWTGQSLAEFEQSQVQERKTQSAATRQSGGDGLLESVLGHWTSLKVFEYFNRAGEIRRKGEELKLGGNGGLYVDPDGNRWFCFSADLGGGPFQAWQYCKDGTTNTPTGRGFYELLCEMAEAGGIPIPQPTRPEMPPEPEPPPDDWLKEPPGEEIITPAQAPQPVRPAAERFKIHTAAEALEPLDPIKWRVKDLIEAGSVIAFIGDAGSGKTYMLLDLLVSIANGERSWADFELDNHCPVLVIDEESGDRRIKRRLSYIMRAHGAGADLPLYYVTLARFDIRNPEDVNTLHGLIQMTGAGVVLIDAFMDVIPGADENSSKDVQPGLLALGMLSKTTDAAITLIHHTNKAGGYRGSTAIKGSVDGMYIIEKAADSPVLEVKTEKGRDVKAARFTLIAHFTTDPVTGELSEVSFSPADPKEKPVHFNKAQAYVLRYLLEHKQAAITEIMEAADTCTAQAARQAVYNLTDKGFTRRIDAGGPGVKATYSLTEKGEQAA